LAGTRTRIAVVQRSEAARGWPFELDQAIPESRIDAIRLGPVDPSGLSRILRTTLGWAPAWPRLLRIAELSGGNPFRLIVEDEVVLCLFEGSATAVRSVAERAAIPFGRILRGTGAPWSKDRSSHDAA
jgi:hypothetical protein